MSRQKGPFSVNFPIVKNRKFPGHRPVDPCLSRRVSQGHPAGVPGIFLSLCVPFFPEYRKVSRFTPVIQGKAWNGLSFRKLLKRIRENQTCTELRSTISRHLLPPISGWGKTMDSYRRFCRNSMTSHRKRAFSGTGKRQIPLREKGGKGDTKR